MKKRFIPLLLSLVLSSISLASCGRDLSKVRVMVSEGEGYSVEGENPLTLHPGEEFSFTLSPEFGYHFDSVESSASFSGNQLHGVAPSYSSILHPVFLPTSSVSLQIHRKTYLSSVEVIYQYHEGYPKECILEGDTITLEAKTNSSEYFYGFSKNAYLDEGGELLSIRESYPVLMDKNVEVYANFIAKKDIASSKVVFYDLNGGYLEGHEEETGTSQAASGYTFHTIPNSLNFLDAPFHKDGSLLIGYNTKKDYTGRLIHLGSRFDLDELENKTLYCVYKEFDPASSFTYVANEDNGITITGVSSPKEEMVIPQEIEGKPVTNIKRGAFKDVPLLSSLILPPTIVKADGGAFDTESLKTLTLYDNIKDISDEGIQNSMETLYINAAMAPRCSLSEALCFVDELPIIEKMDPSKPRLILTGDSSTRYGFRTDTIQEAYPGYSCFNFGTTAQMTDFFYVHLLSTYLKEGDIIMWGTNNHLYTSNNFFNKASSLDWVLQFLECDYDLLSRLNMQLFTEAFLSDFKGFNEARERMEAMTYTTPSNWKSTEYGDYLCERPDRDDDDYLKDNQGYRSSVDSFLSEKRLTRLKSFKEECDNRNIGLNLVGFPICYNYIDTETYDESFFSRFYAKIEENTGIKMLSDEFDYILSPRIFYNSEYHVTNNGCVIRTKMFLEDIASYMEAR